MNKTAKTVYISILVAQALVLFIIESMIPLPFITPGVKLGLANIATVIALYTLESKKEVFLVVILRVILSLFLGGNLSTFIYSAAGAVLSFLAMSFFKKIGKDHLSIIGVSAAGAVFHNVGQLLAASAAVQNIKIMLYLPILSITAIVTGVFIGITSNYLIKYIMRTPYFKKKY